MGKSIPAFSSVFKPAARRSMFARADRIDYNTSCNRQGEIMADRNATYAQRYYEAAMDHFERGRYDKALWVVAFVVLFVIAPFAFLYWKRASLTMRAADRQPPDQSPKQAAAG